MERSATGLAVELAGESDAVDKAMLGAFRDCRCSPASGRWKFRVDPCQTARLVEHVMAVSH
jgi:hypothetical protein